MEGAEADSGQKESQEKQAELKRQERMIGVVKKFGYPFPDKKPEDLTSNELRYLYAAIHQIQEKYKLATEKREEGEGHIEPMLEAAEKADPGDDKPSQAELRAVMREVWQFELGWRGRQEHSRRRRY